MEFDPDFDVSNSHLLKLVWGDSAHEYASAELCIRSNNL